MKGPQPPTLTSLVDAYGKLQNASRALTENEIVELATLTRFDPRLMEQLILHLSLYWMKISAVELNQRNQTQIWPQTLAVCLEQCSTLVTKNHLLFIKWSETVTTNIEPAPYQSYFIGLKPFVSKSANAAALHPLKVFEKWGFAECELQINKILNYPSNSYSIKARENLLIEYTNTHKRFSIRHYLELCKFSISARQAQRDLKSFRWLTCSGDTKARTYKAR